MSEPMGRAWNIPGHYIVFNIPKIFCSYCWASGVGFVVDLSYPYTNGDWSIPEVPETSLSNASQSLLQWAAFLLSRNILLKPSPPKAFPDHVGQHQSFLPYSTIQVICTTQLPASSLCCSLLCAVVPPRLWGPAGPWLIQTEILAIVNHMHRVY